ncbi:MAG: hypothetical protein MO853_01015 [Candidatus Protistobacter heckmanni]|nr:hypothetical protein [Candidatus Protistobacter heckmanni]
MNGASGAAAGWTSADGAGEQEGRRKKTVEPKGKPAHAGACLADIVLKSITHGLVRQLTRRHAYLDKHARHACERALTAY